jgi:hypothetical protein
VESPSISNEVFQGFHVRGKHVRKLLKVSKTWLNRLPNTSNTLDLFHEGTLHMFRIICRIIQRVMTSFMVLEGRGIGSIIGRTSESLGIFVLASFFNLVIFILKHYTTFAYVFQDFFKV